MLIRVRDIPLVFAATTIALLIFAFAWTAPWPQLCPQQHPQSDYSNKNDPGAPSQPITTGQNAAYASADQCDEHAQSDWWVIKIGIATVVILFGQFVMFGWQLRAMVQGVAGADRAANIAKDSLIVGNGAFVFVPDYAVDWHVDPENPDGDIVSWAFRPFWQNSGNTPTKNMMTMVAAELLPDPIDANFDFTKTVTSPHPALIGPRSGIRGGSARDFSVADLEDVAAGKRYLYLWGCATYDDVFQGTKGHITRYCITLGVGGDLRTRPGPDGKIKALFNFGHHVRGNCADDECRIQGLGRA